MNDLRNTQRCRAWRQRYQQHIDQQVAAVVEERGRNSASIIQAARDLARSRNDDYEPAGWYDAALYLIQHKERKDDGSKTNA